MRQKKYNEYGVKLDSNGYAPSLFAHESFRCYRCHRFGDTARHEIYGGSRRKASKALGLWINVCPDCHAAIHASGILQYHYHKQGQLLAEAYYHWNHDDFRRRFYKNYLED